MTLCRSRPGSSPSHGSHSGKACKRFIGKACRDRALIWFGVTRGVGCPWWRSMIPSRMICLVPVCLAGLAHARKLTSCSGCLRQAWKLGMLLLAVRPGCILLGPKGLLGQSRATPFFNTCGQFLSESHCLAHRVLRQLSLLDCCGYASVPLAVEAGMANGRPAIRSFFKGASWQQWRLLEHLLGKSLLLCMRMPRGCYCRASLRSCRSGPRPATGWQGRCNGEGGLGSLALHGITWQGPSWRQNASESYRRTRVPWLVA